MNFLTLFSISFLSLLLSACASVSVSQMQTELSNSAKAASSIDEIIFTPILEENAQSIELGNKSPSFLFENGKNYFAAYRIENYNNPRYLQIKTYLSSIVLPTASILVPEVTILDKDKKVINTIKLTKLVKDLDAWKGTFFRGKMYPSSKISVYHNPQNGYLSQGLGCTRHGRKTFYNPIGSCRKLRSYVGQTLAC